MSNVSVLNIRQIHFLRHGNKNLTPEIESLFENSKKHGFGRTMYHLSY